ncbi:MAG: hypothetical protein L0Y67_08755 [Gammaproteobacteria bacterium]|nr:hypothetical protein [Gammaproteobacteria bacterium]MCI0591661.1 hypothetical protein [Gammaproteobacteria bacterium]
MIQPRMALIVGLIAVAVLTRLLPHPPNFVPIAAIALFGGAYFADKTSAFLVPLIALLVSDAVLGFHSTLAFVYLAFALTVAIGFWVRRNRSGLRIFSAALLSSVLFYLLTNLGVWLVEGLYPKDGAGLVSCYMAGIPFFAMTVLGTLFYATLLFGTMGFAERYIPIFREQSILT